MSGEEDAVKVDGKCPTHVHGDEVVEAFGAGDEGEIYFFGGGEALHAEDCAGVA